MALDQSLMQFVVMIFGASAFILIMFLPALLELKQPKDAGPRRIMDEIVAGQRPGP